MGGTAGIKPKIMKYRVILKDSKGGIAMDDDFDISELVTGGETAGDLMEWLEEQDLIREALDGAPFGEIRIIAY